MTIDDRIRDEKWQYDINREAAKISLLSGKIDKYEYLTGEKISPSHQRQIIEQATITKSFWKTNKNDWRARIKGNTAKKIFNDFNNGIELLKKYSSVR